MNKILILTIYGQLRTFILYGVIGAFSAGSDFLIFYSLTTFLGIYYLVANTISVTVGITSSFILNKNYNFKVKDKIFRRFIVFISVGFGGLLLSSVLLLLFIDILNFEKIHAKVLSIVLVVFIQFLLNKYITFKR